MNGSWGVWHYVGTFRHTQGWRLHRDAFGISMEQPSHGSQTSDVETFEREPGKAEEASSATSDVAAAAGTAATPASSGGSREAAGWHVDGAADGGATDGAASGGADGEELEQEPGEAEEASSATGNSAHPL